VGPYHNAPRDAEKNPARRGAPSGAAWFTGRACRRQKAATTHLCVRLNLS
jgi:hypothetical protein